MYWNYPQRAQERMALVVKTQRRAEVAHRSRIAAAVREVDPEQPIYDARTLDDVIDRSLGQRRFQMLLLGVFAAIALVLASIGAYGVIAYGVGQRLREFGVRIALGARRRDVIAHGAAARRRAVRARRRRSGSRSGRGASALLSTLVYGVAPRDAVSFVVATVVLLVVSLVACYVPARRAARVDPSIALRSE